MGLIVMIPVALIVGALYLNHRIAKKFEEIVFAKGYGTELKAYYMCFWLGIVGYLYVIALPNAKLDNIELKQQKRMLEILSKLGTKTEDDCDEKENAEVI